MPGKELASQQNLIFDAVINMDQLPGIMQDLLEPPIEFLAQVPDSFGYLLIITGGVGILWFLIERYFSKQPETQEFRENK